MNRTILLLFLIGVTADCVVAQSYKVHGKITNTWLEPLAFASVQVKEWKHGVVTKEDGTYELQLDPGKYDLVISMIGYKSQVLTIIIQKADYLQNIIMEVDDSKGLSEVVVKGKSRDRSEEIIRNVIHRKDSIQSAAGPYSCMVYIKAVQEDSLKIKGKKKPVRNDTIPVINADKPQSLWVITHTQLKFPKYHLPEYDFFEVEQQYELVNDTAWM